MTLTAIAVRSIHRRSWLIALCLTANLASATPIAAQPAPGSAVGTASTSGVRLPVFNGIDRPPDRFAVDLTGGSFAQQRVRSRDSLANGAIIGAAIGAATFGAFAAVLCHAYREQGGPSCLHDTLRFAAIGGAIGGGVGLSIDAARSQRGVTLRVAIRF